MTLSADEVSFLDAWASCSSPTSLSFTASVPSSPSDYRSGGTTAGTQGTSWSPDEHERFLEAMQLYPTGPWTAIAAHIGTRSSRQARTHAQKHKEKLRRRQRKLHRMQSYLSADASAVTSTKNSDCGDDTGSGSSSFRRQGIPWTPAEQDRLREALEMNPQGPWRVIAAHVGTRTIRQVMAFGHKRRLELTAPSSRSSSGEQDVESLAGRNEMLDSSDLSLMDELFAQDLSVPAHEANGNNLIDQLLFDDEANDVWNNFSVSDETGSY